MGAGAGDGIVGAGAGDGIVAGEGTVAGDGTVAGEGTIPSPVTSEKLLFMRSKHILGEQNLQKLM